MIRHMYHLPYDKMLQENTVDGSAVYSTNKDLLFHIAVFTAADKYDVASLRPLVVKKFKDLMEIWQSSPKFATSIQKLMGPSAGHLADDTLQAAAADDRSESCLWERRRAVRLLPLPRVCSLEGNLR
jgi:hypothetical protein